MLLATALTAIAADSINQSFDATGGSSLAVSSVSSLAQTFTLATTGKLTSVALQISRSEEASGEFSLIILPTTSSGKPDGSAKYLFSQTFPVAAIAAVGPFQYTYQKFDISAAELEVLPGDQLAVALVHAGFYPNWVNWAAMSPGGYSRGSAFVETSGQTTNWETLLIQPTGPTSDLGFQIYVSGTADLIGLGMPLIKAAIERKSRNN